MSSSKMALKEIASVSAGQTFRDRAEADTSYSAIRLLQIKDIKEGRFCNAGALPYANLGENQPRVKLNRGEILVPLRGARSEAMLFDVTDETQITTTTNQVAIISPNTNFVTPEYLLWFLNSSRGNEKIHKMKTKGTILQLSIKNLAELSVDVPALPVQSEIVEIYDNWQQQRDVLYELVCNGDILAEKICIEKIANTRGAR